MADLLGANRVPLSEERTVPEEEAGDADAFEGLPVGGTLDDAARAMRTPTLSPAAVSGGAAVSSSAGAVPETAEDPLTLALRIAHQAQAAALAAAAAASEEEPPSNGATHPDSEPIAEPTVPGVPSFAGTNGAKGLQTVSAGSSSKVGVVPEEPDNEDTVRRAGNATTSTVDSGMGAEATIPEPTLASESDLLVSDTSDNGPVIGEETPALTESQRASLLAEESEPETVEVPAEPRFTPRKGSVVPEAPSAEPTPSSPRPAPMPAEPREEPTIRKSSPPPALVAPAARLASRTGTGPSGIGALGFRISSNRAVVRPNGRPAVAAAGAAAATPAAGTPMSGSTSIERSGERVSMERVSLDRPSRTGIPAARASIPPIVTAVADPPPLVSGRIDPADEPRGGVPVWLLGAGVGAVTLLVGGLAFILFGGAGNPDLPVATPMPTPTSESTPDATETSIAVLATPIATPTIASTRTPSQTATRTSAATPNPTPTPTATVAAPSPTPFAVAASSKTPPPGTPKADTGKELFEEAVRGKTHAGARLALMQLAKKPENLSKPDFVFESWKFLAKNAPASEAEFSKKIAYDPFAKEFLLRHRTDNRGGLVRGWADGYVKPNP